MQARSATLLALACVMSLGPPSQAAGPGLDTLGGMLQSELGLEPRQVEQVLDTASALDPSAFATYRSAGDAAASPTLGGDAVAPVTPLQIGVHFIAWDDPATIPDLPADGVLEGAGGRLRGGIGGGIQPLRPYLVAHAVFPRDIPTAEPLEHFVDYSFLLQLPGHETWDPEPAFPADPRTGASHVVSLGRGPGPWALSLSEVVDGEVRPVGTSGFAIVSGSTLVVGIDLASVVGLGPEWEFGHGFAAHVHDGRYGACERCPSRISVLPGFPRDAFPPYRGGPLIKPGFDGHFEVSEVVAIAALDGLVWLDFAPVEPWDGNGMPADHFSQYFQFGVAIPDDQAGAFFGVRDHDGALTSFGSGPDGDIPSQIYVMSDGSVVARTNFTSQQAVDGIDVTFEGGYLSTEDAAFASITQAFNIPGAAVVEGDPLAHDGAHPVFDFAALQPVPPPTSAPPTSAAVTTAPASTGTSTTAVTVTTAAPGITTADDTCWGCWGLGALAVGLPIGVILWRRRRRGIEGEGPAGTADS